MSERAANTRDNLAESQMLVTVGGMKITAKNAGIEAGGYA
jgi:hypothetical protein